MTFKPQKADYPTMQISRNPITSNRRSNSMCIALLFLLLPLAGSVMAAEVPKFDQRVSIAAREQPVKDFFAELFGRLGVPVHVDQSIVGTVNGDFVGSARNIYKDVEKAFQLVMYYDRSKVYIYSSKQLQRNIIPMDQQLAKKVLENTRKMRIEDSINKAVWSDMGLVVSGTQRFRNQIDSYTRAIKGSVRKVDTPREEVIRVFKLKYAWADDTTVVSGGQEVQVRGVASLLRTVIESGMVGVQQSPGSTRSNLPRTENGLRGKGLQAVGSASGSNATNKSATQLASGRRHSNSNVAGSTANSRIVADPLNNAIIIRDLPERMQSYQELIDTLDIEPQMVEIEATIIDMDTDRLRSLGIDWRYQKDGTSILFGSAGATNDLLGTNPAAVAEGLNGFTQNVLNNKARFLSHIRALESQGAARIVSKPHVMTLANVEALLDTTSTFFVRVAGREEVDLFNVSVGTTMRVTPHVLDHGSAAQIKMKIDIVDGTQSQQTVDNIPVIDESTINTQAIINAGQSLLIGGLVREIKSTGVSKVPLLGDIPGLGALFRNNRKTSSRMERMFLITPRLNTQVSAGKRYSVPILSGSEAQIIHSSPARLNSALAGLASRDQSYPLRPELASGSANISLTSKHQPLSTLSDYQQGTQGNSQGSPSIRDRMINRQSPLPPSTVPISQPLQQAAGSNALDQTTGFDSVPYNDNSEIAQRAAPDSNSSWQAVQRKVPLPAHESVTQAQANATVRQSQHTTDSVARATIEHNQNDDGWVALTDSGFRKTRSKGATTEQSSLNAIQRKHDSGINDSWQEIK